MRTVIPVYRGSVSGRGQSVVARSASASGGTHLGHSISAAILSIALSTSPVYADTMEKPALPETVYFGNGCFWGRQKEYVDTEKEQLGRKAPSAVVGYAGGKAVGPDGKVK